MPSTLQQMRQRRDSRELDVFEATKYFSGEIGTARGPMRDVPQREADQLRENNTETMEMISYVKEEGNCKQRPCSRCGKLASLLYSLFQLSPASKKKKKKKKKKQQQQQQQLPKSSKSEIEEEKLRKKNTLYVSSASSSEFLTPSLYSSKRKAWEEMFASEFCCHEPMKQEELWGVELKLEEKREFRKEEEEEEDGAESDSSSDLFELKSYDLNDLPTELSVMLCLQLKGYNFLTTGHVTDLYWRRKRRGGVDEIMLAKRVRRMMGPDVIYM